MVAQDKIAAQVTWFSEDRVPGMRHDEVASAKVSRGRVLLLRVRAFFNSETSFHVSSLCLYYQYISVYSAFTLHTRNINCCVEDCIHTARVDAMSFVYS